jgi:hypothetical protein
MSGEDADRLGPKGHVYVELVREQWRAPLERGSARRALLTSLFAVCLIGFGVGGLFVVPGESVILMGIGLVAVVATWPELQLLRPEFEEARRIGWVEPALDDNSVTLGEPSTFRAVLHARRTLTLQSASLLVEAHSWDASRAQQVLVSMPFPVTQQASRVRAGQDWRESMTFRIPPTAPASFYGASESVRWSLTLELAFADEAIWRRSWPMLVFPAEDA